MPRIYQTQSHPLQLALAVRAKRPAGLAQTFAAHVVQLYDRTGFDAMAREVHELYAAHSPDDATTFRARLDRRLYDRHHEPVAWECAAPMSATTATAAAAAPTVRATRRESETPAPPLDHAA